MNSRLKDVNALFDRARPLVGQHAPEIQKYGMIVRLPNALSEEACAASVQT